MYNIPASKLASRRKEKNICEARYMAYLYLHSVIGLPSGEIGKYFNRDRVNIIRGIRILKGWMNYHCDTKERYEAMIEKLKGGN